MIRAQTLVMAVQLSMAGSAWAQESSTPNATERWESLSDEQRQSLRESFREFYERRRG